MENNSTSPTYYWVGSSAVFNPDIHISDNFLIKLGDSNEVKIRVAEYLTILFQQGQPRFILNLKQLSNVFKSNRMGIEPESNGNRTQIEHKSNMNQT